MFPRLARSCKVNLTKRSDLATNMTSEPAEASEAPSRYVVGIDLGTTNSAVAYVDTASEPWQVRTFAVPQLVAAGVVEARETLPSFHYQPAEANSPPGRCGFLGLPKTRTTSSACWPAIKGRLSPAGLITSAKSWLCHSGVDRLADLLPWHGAADVDRLSPVEVSARYLAHLRAAWNHRFPRDPLEAQDVVLTLPASFDEVARELTVKAAARAELAASGADRRTASGHLSMDRRASRPAGNNSCSRARKF